MKIHIYIPLHNFVHLKGHDFLIAKEFLKTIYFLFQSSFIFKKKLSREYRFFRIPSGPLHVQTLSLSTFLPAGGAEIMTIQ